MNEERDPTPAERKLYAEVCAAVLDTLEPFLDHALTVRDNDTIDPSIILDATLRAVADIVVANHHGAPPHNCKCEENAVRSLRYALKASRDTLEAHEPSHAQH
jgi:hypothetical protein